MGGRREGSDIGLGGVWTQPKLDMEVTQTVAATAPALTEPPVW